jgi:hypothetical protein
MGKVKYRISGFAVIGELRGEYLFCRSLRAVSGVTGVSAKVLKDAFVVGEYWANSRWRVFQVEEKGEERGI